MPQGADCRAREAPLTDLPKTVHLIEEGPREGFQYEKQEIPTARKIALIDALSKTGLSHIQAVSFVHPKFVPGMADAEAVMAGVAIRDGVSLSALWLNEQGFDRARACSTVDLRGSVVLSASRSFLQRNQRRTPEEQFAAQQAMIARYKAHGIAIERLGIMAAFGCNFEGDIPLDHLLSVVDQHLALARDEALSFDYLLLADTMAWATPLSIKRTVGAIRERHPDLEIALHLHDTRGMGIANAYAGLEMGVRYFDSSVGGLGGCPFAGHAGAAGNVCTEDLVFLCDELGIETGVDLEALIACARLAEEIVGHPLPGSVKTGGSLASCRARLRGARE
jgi:hydroxymethylglutaryl-CoA lyase